MNTIFKYSKIYIQLGMWVKQKYQITIPSIARSNERNKDGWKLSYTQPHTPTDNMTEKTIEDYQSELLAITTERDNLKAQFDSITSELTQTKSDLVKSRLMVGKLISDTSVSNEEQESVKEFNWEEDLKKALEEDIKRK